MVNSIMQSPVHKACPASKHVVRLGAGSGQLHPTDYLLPSNIPTLGFYPVHKVIKNFFCLF